MNEKELKKILIQAKKDADTVKNQGQLNQVKARFVGRNSQLAQALRLLPKLTLHDRKTQGKLLNRTRQDLEQIFSQRSAELLRRTDFAPVDLTAPGDFESYGHLHPSSRILAQIYAAFTSLGFAIVDGPEIETDWYNFEVLNMPPEHPAREMQDTFYLEQHYQGRPLIPRTHTSGMQVRFLEKNPPPAKIIVPGRVFRNENEDATHAWIFTQVEGLVVGEGVSLSDLKGTLEYFIKAVLGQQSEIRLRPSFFPYTEPSVEVDARYSGQWLEMLGAGMVHPAVLERAGIDSSQYSGFAFGVGVERLSQVKFGIADLRLNWRPNLSFLEQF